MSSASSVIANVLCCFHDGTIVEYQESDGELRLTVLIPYLAERIHPDFETLVVELAGVEDLRFRTWPRCSDEQPTDTNAVSGFLDSELEILNASLEDGYVTVACRQDDSSSNYVGGVLTFSATAIQIFDPSRRRIEPEELMRVASAYWRR